MPKIVWKFKMTIIRIIMGFFALKHTEAMKIAKKSEKSFKKDIDKEGEGMI